MVNNAGILRDRTFAKLDIAELEETLAVHLLGAVHVTQPAFAAMKERGYGRVVNTTSAVGIWGNFGQASYAAAKMGIIGLTNVLAIEGARHNIRVNAVAPIARTPGAAGLEIFDGFGDAVSAEHVAPLVCFPLASERCDITQHLFTAGGGYFARAFISVTEGWFAGLDGPPSAEEVEANLEQILSPDRARIPNGLADEGAHLLGLLGEANKR